MSARDRVRILDLQADCTIGIYPEERRQPQPLRLSMDLSLDTRGAGRQQALAQSVDYDALAQQCTSLLRFREYGLLETATEELAAMVLGLYPQVDELEVTLHKPWGLRGRAMGVEVRIRRDRSDLCSQIEHTAWGHVRVLMESNEAGLYVLVLRPGACIPLHEHRVMRELEWRIRGDLERDGELLAGVAPMVWPRGRRHHYRNVGHDVAEIFCCDMPRFIAADEIVVESERIDDAPSQQRVQGEVDR